MVQAPPRHRCRHHPGQPARRWGKVMRQNNAAAQWGLAPAARRLRGSMTRLLAACAIAGGASCLARKRARLSQQADPHHRAVHAGRLQRRGGARNRDRIAGTPQADGGGREQARRRRHHRLFVRGEVAAGRPPHADRAGLVHHGPASVAQPASTIRSRNSRRSTWSPTCPSSWWCRRPCR